MLARFVRDYGSLKRSPLTSIWLAFFQWTWSSQFFLGFFLLVFHKRIFGGWVAQIFTVGCYSSEPASSVKVPKKVSTDSQGKSPTSLILSASNSRLLMEGSFLPLCWLFDTVTSRIIEGGLSIEYSCCWPYWPIHLTTFSGYKLTVLCMCTSVHCMQLLVVRVNCVITRNCRHMIWW